MSEHFLCFFLLVFKFTKLREQLKLQMNAGEWRSQSAPSFAVCRSVGHAVCSVTVHCCCCCCYLLQRTPTVSPLSLSPQWLMSAAFTYHLQWTCSSSQSLQSHCIQTCTVNDLHRHYSVTLERIRSKQFDLVQLQVELAWRERPLVVLNKQPSSTGLSLL